MTDRRKRRVGRGLWAMVLAAVVASPSAFLSSATAQIDPADLLPVEEAFSLSATSSEDAQAIVLTWAIAEGYYLYRHAFGVEAIEDRLVLQSIEPEPGDRYSDEFFGEVEVYRGQARVRVPVTSWPDSATADLNVKFQGCADLGVCYPPHRQRVSVQRPAGAVPGAGASAAVLPAMDPSPSPGGLDALLSSFDSPAQQLTGRSDPLPPEEAFRVETIALGPQELLARFTVHPDYYLYRDTVAFRTPDSDLRLGAPVFPAAESINDEFFGDTFVYYNEVELPIALERPPGPARSLELEVDFQGCQTDGICYPPMTRTISVGLPALAAGRSATSAVGSTAETAEPLPAASAGTAAAERALPETEQSRLAGALAERPMLALVLFFVAGVLLAFTPCVFPMVPILSGLIAGDAERMTTGRAFRLSVVYVLAMAVVYTAFGVIAALLGQNLQAVFQHPAVLVSFALLFVLLSLAMFGFYELQLPASLQTRLNALSNKQQGGTLLGAAIMGGLSALVVGPCVAPALMGALIYIGQTGDAVLGGAALFAMALGMGVPLVIWGTSAGNWLPRAGGWMAAVKAVFGVGLLALAIWMLERVLPGSVIMLLWGALALISGVYLGAFDGRSDGGWSKLWQGLGLILVLIGALQFIGAAAGGNDWLRPLAPFAGGSGGGPGASVPAPEFVEVDNLDELQRAVAAAGRTVFLDFYADWCVDCKRMERRTFPEPAVAAAMSEFDLLKIDLTDFNDDHREVLAEFGLIGPPAYLFFDGGRELESFRMFGFMAPAEFRDHLARVRTAAGY